MNTPPLTTVHHRINNLLQRTLAPSTTITYQSAFTSYTDFCTLHKLQAAPLQEYNLMLYVSQLSFQSSPSNIKIHLAAIKPTTYPEGFCYRFTGMGSQILIPKKRDAEKKKTSKLSRVNLNSNGMFFFSKSVILYND